MHAKRNIALGVILVVAVAAVRFTSIDQVVRQTIGSYQDGQASELLASGTIEATTVDLNAKTPGTLGTLSFQAGDALKAGQVVAQVTRNDLVAQREVNALAVQKAESQLNDLLAGSRSQELRDAVAGVNTAQANYSKATADLNRIENLYQDGANSKSDLEKVQTALEVAQNQLASAQARLSLLEEGSRPNQVKAAQNEVERAKAVLKVSDAMLADLKILSPINGVVLARHYQPGEFVQAGASLGSMADFSHLWVKVYIATVDLPYVKLGQPVNVTVSGLKQNFTGTVEEIATKGEFTPKTIQTQQERANVVFAVKVGVNDVSGALKPGMPADVSFGPRRSP